MADAQNNQKNQQQDLNQILKVRREKLAALQEAGNLRNAPQQSMHGDWPP